MAMASSPAYSRAHVDHCAFAAWYPALESVSIKSVVVPLPPAYVSLLLADGVKLATTERVEELRDAAKADTGAVVNADAARASTRQQQQDAQKLVREQVERAIKKLGGQVIPKLNWSCPRDASWMLGTLKCSSYEDVFLLLKSSDFAVHDLTEPYAGCSEPEARLARPESAYIVLKKWCNFYDSTHFRCFVVNGTLVGVSQRHCDEFYDFLVDQQDHLCELIYAFFHSHIRQGGMSVFPDPDYIFDVYVDKQHRVFLLDINVFGAVTDPLLFTWDELLEMREARRRKRALLIDDEDADSDDEQLVDFRVVESTKGIRPNPLSSYRTPTDFVDYLAGNGGFDAFIDQVRRDNTGLDIVSSDEDASDDGAEDEDDDIRWGSDDERYD